MFPRRAVCTYFTGHMCRFRLERRVPLLLMTATSIGIEHLSLRGDAPAGNLTGASVGAAAAIAAPEIGLTLYGDLEAVASVWRGFEQVAGHTFFQTHAWLDAWQRHVGAING